MALKTRIDMYCECSVIVLTIFNEEAYLTFKSIFHKTLNLFQFDCKIMHESVPGTNQ